MHSNDIALRVLRRLRGVIRRVAGRVRPLSPAAGRASQSSPTERCDAVGGNGACPVRRRGGDEVPLAGSLMGDALSAGWEIALRDCVQFYRYIRVTLLLSRPGDFRVSDVSIEEDAPVRAGVFEVRRLGDSTQQLTIELFGDETCFEGLSVHVGLSRPREPIAVFGFTPAEAAMVQYGREERANPCRAEFFRLMHERPTGRLLEIGSRARSGVSRREVFGDRPYVGVDVLPGEGVSVVGDVHALSTLVEPGSIDFIFSASVFEHLIMPWKVAVEMNRVMRTGSVALIVTHQTCGLHDSPWDFWRFSDTCWRGLFNTRTGFEIVTTTMNVPVYVVPFLRLSSFKGFEGAAGFYQSAVLIRKMDDVDASLQWDVPVEVVIGEQYPA